MRPIDAGSLQDNLTDIYGDGNRLVYLKDVLNLIDEQPTFTPPNEPLTLEELREMNGEPVYVVPANEYSELGKWCVISIGDSDDYSCALVPGVEYWSWKFEGYGEQWLAYRRPPEGEEEP
ncbi:hypothetical protein AAAT68_17035 [Lawsonibacter asaccharolyticus]